ANTDIYWVTAWGMLLGLPAVALAHKLWNGHRRVAVALLVASAFLASFVTSIRIQSGLPILISGLGVALVRGGRRWSTAALAPALVVAYLSVSTGVLTGVRAYRDHVVDSPGFGAGQPTEHPFWHNAYIGLGYLPNRYGIAWDDSIASDAVARARPGTPYL